MGDNPYAPWLWMTRHAGQRALPIPETGGDLAELRELHPALADDYAWALVSSWALSAFRPSGGYAVLFLRGVAGSGKTTLARLLLSILDPRDADLRRPPGNTRDLIAAASSSRIYALDNISQIPEWLADDLCRIATGAALTTRELYATADEHVARVRCPILLTSVPDVVSSRGDLRDRTVLVELPQLQDADRLEDAVLDHRVEMGRPRILGALLSAVSTAMRRRDSTEPVTGSCMVDHLHPRSMCRRGPWGASQKALQIQRLW